MSNKSIEEIRNELSYEYEASLPDHRNCWGCCRSSSDFENAFQAGFDKARELDAAEIAKLKRMIVFMKSSLGFIITNHIYSFECRSYAETALKEIEEIERDEG